jgi:hypothetical protein
MVDIKIRTEEMRTDVSNASAFSSGFFCIISAAYSKRLMQLSLIEVLQGMKTQSQVNPIQKSGGGSE